MRKLLLLLIAYGLPALATAQGAEQNNQAVPYTLADRDRMVRLEAKLEGFIAESNRRFEETNRRLEELNGSIGTTRSEIHDAVATAQETTLWMRGVLGALIVALFGFIVYDRREASRQAYRPLTDDIRRLQQEVERLKAHFPNEAA